MRSNETGLIWRMRDELGMVIPVWFPPTVPILEAAGYLRTTLADVEYYCSPANVWLIVDNCAVGAQAAEEVVQEVKKRCGEECGVDVATVRQGKGGVVIRGLRRLIETGRVAYLVVRDCDGDHDIHDLPRLFRRITDTVAREETDNVFGVGSRPSPQMGLGWVRGEYELLLNRALVEACNVALAREGRHVDLRYSLAGTRYPDFQSGYKLYTRRTAQLNIDGMTTAIQQDPGAEASLWGAEFVTVTEMLLAGALPVEISRLTYDEQPQTTFDESNRVHAFGRQFVWLFSRLGTPSAVARLIVDNAITHSSLRFVSGLWTELLAFREYIRKHAYPPDDWGKPPPHGELL
ncbi:MAG: hypothetical protein ACUVX8_03410 [Candidatus Zipacnadales bacterium]